MGVHQSMITDRGPPGKRAALTAAARAFPRTNSKVLPKVGWVRTIREALGISQSQLAVRAGISRATVQKLERAEAHRRITLGSLDRMAHAMGCQVALAIVPKGGTLEDIRRKQALAKAEALVNPHLQPAGTSDGENVSAGLERRQARLIARLLRGSPRKLWR